MGMKKLKITVKSCMILLMFVMLTFQLQAQEKFKYHTVKEGETIYGIAKLYRVTPYAILQQNPEIKNVEDLKPNTYLVIPLVSSTATIDENVEEKTKEQVEPIGFVTHKVKRKETLYRLAKEYGVTEEQIKRYNTNLYSEPLQKKMVLKIPKYPKLKDPTEQDLEMLQYMVKPKETRWSIANKFGISLDSLEQLNPQLDKNSTYLANGQMLKVPRPKGDSLEEQVSVVYESFTVPKSIGIYRVSQNYGISADSIIKLNPQITEAGGLKEGMVLRLPKKRAENKEVNVDNFNFYIVKPQQGIFRLTKVLDISKDSLFLFNPELENGVKAGMVLKVPKKKSGNLQVKNSLVLDKISLVDSINTDNKPNILFMLPFRINKVDFANEEKAKAWVTRVKDTRGALGFYSGALVALDSLKKMGLSINAKFVDTERDVTKVRNYLTTNSLQDFDAVVGPIDPSLLPEIAYKSISTEKAVPVIAPFASTSILGFDNIFYANPKDDILRERMLNYVKSNRKDEEIIIIADAKHQSVKDSIVKALPFSRVAKMSKDGSLHLVDFEAMLMKDKTYWVFVETSDANLASSIISILNAANTELDYTVRMFTTNYDRAFEASSISKPHLSNLKFTFPSEYKGYKNDSFVKAFNQKFGYDPDRYAVKGFDVTYDLLLKLAFKKNLFFASQFVGTTEYSGNKFDYFTNHTNGYYNQATYLMQYKDLQIIQLEEENDVKGNVSR